MDINLDNLTVQELKAMRSEIDRRLNERGTVKERRDYRDGWLQNEYRRNKIGLRGPYWYFYRIVDGKRERVYIGKTDDPESKLAERV